MDFFFSFEKILSVNQFLSFRSMKVKEQGLETTTCSGSLS